MPGMSCRVGKKEEGPQAMFGSVQTSEGLHDERRGWGIKEQQKTNLTMRRLELVIEREVTTVLVLHLRYRLIDLLGAVHDTSLLVLANTLLEEVGLATERNVLHEVEGVGDAVDLLVAESNQETVGHELNVLLHEVGVHAEKGTGESLSQELLLDLDSVDDDCLDDILARSVVQVGEQEAGEVGVQTLVTRDELVGEGQSRHETALLQPEDGGESTAEEDTLNGSEGDQTLSKGRVLVRDPLESPVGLLSDGRD
jgi:hypothetical protein